MNNLSVCKSSKETMDRMCNGLRRKAKITSNSIKTWICWPNEVFAWNLIVAKAVGNGDKDRIMMVLYKLDAFGVRLA